jgi:hypothetical protein
MIPNRQAHLAPIHMPYATAYEIKANIIRTVPTPRIAAGRKLTKDPMASKIAAR